MKLVSILRRKNPLVLAIAALTLALVPWVGYAMAATRLVGQADWPGGTP